MKSRFLVAKKNYEKEMGSLKIANPVSRQKEIRKDR